MNSPALKLDSLTKTFGRRMVFDKLTYEFYAGNVYGVSGPNGSGKSTLSKIIAGIILPTSGAVLHSNNLKVIKGEELHNHIGFVSPYLILYDEFSAVENLEHFARIRGTGFDRERENELLNKFNIYTRRNDYVKTYSSGMKQRLKFVFALIHNPSLIILDEPTSNLDSGGKAAVCEIIKEESPEKIIIIASNEEADLRQCGEILDLENYKLKNEK